VKRPTIKEFLFHLEGQLISLKSSPLVEKNKGESWTPRLSLLNHQEREIASNLVGQIIALEEVRSILLGERKNFI
jgi:hypothetical protein